MTGASSFCDAILSVPWPVTAALVMECLPQRKPYVFPEAHPVTAQTIKQRLRCSRGPTLIVRNTSRRTEGLHEHQKGR
jgi:hypothetical protein